MVAARWEGAMSLQESVPFEVSVRVGFGTIVLDLRGEFDLSEVEAFRRCMDGVIASCQRGAVVVDLADVTFMDSSAIQALLGARRCLAGGRQLRLQHVTAPVARILELAGLTNLLGDTAETGSQPAAD